MPKIKCKCSSPEHLCRSNYFTSNRRLVEWLLRWWAPPGAVTWCTPHQPESGVLWMELGQLTLNSLRNSPDSKDSSKLQTWAPRFNTSFLKFSSGFGVEIVVLVCLFVAVVFGGEAKFSFGGLRCILQHLRNIILIQSKIWPALPKHRYLWVETRSSTSLCP